VALVLSGCVVRESGCPRGTVDCGDYCADLRYDALDCGACGASCAVGDYCSGGLCYVGSCWPDDSVCGYDSQCCSGYCASDGHCGCMLRGDYGCAANVDCCSSFCGYDGYCR